MDERVMKTVVYILSTDYAGSHYLSLMLGSHSRVMHLGEAKRLKRSFRRQGVICFTCKDKGTCPVLGGIGPHNVASLYDIVFSRIDPATEVLIDNSKLISGWADRFLRNGRFQYKVIHLIRDPRALVRRWMIEPPGPKRVSRQFRRWAKITWRRPGLSLPALTGGRTALLMYTWLVQNQRIESFIKSNRLDSCLVTYRDLARNTPGELSRIIEWMGLSFEPGQIEYWNFPHHGTQKDSYEWILQAKTPYFDTRWKSFLTPEIIEQISTDPAIRGYLQHLGLTLTGEGLTRSRSDTALHATVPSPAQ